MNEIKIPWAGIFLVFISILNIIAFIIIGWSFLWWALYFGSMQLLLESIVVLLISIFLIFIAYGLFRGIKSRLFRRWFITFTLFVEIIVLIIIIINFYNNPLPIPSFNEIILVFKSLFTWNINITWDYNNDFSVMNFSKQKVMYLFSIIFSWLLLLLVYPIYKKTINHPYYN